MTSKSRYRLRIWLTVISIVIGIASLAVHGTKFYWDYLVEQPTESEAEPKVQVIRETIVREVPVSPAPVTHAAFAEEAENIEAKPVKTAALPDQPSEVKPKPKNPGYIFFPAGGGKTNEEPGRVFIPSLGDEQEEPQMSELQQQKNSPARIQIREESGVTTIIEHREDGSVILQMTDQE